MIGLDQGVAVVVDGADEHAQRKHITEVGVALSGLHLYFRGDVIQIWLRHLWRFTRPRGDSEGILKNEETGLKWLVFDLGTGMFLAT